MILARLYRLQREVKELRRAYTELSEHYYDTAALLELEQERSARAFHAATEPCERCPDLERERNDALLEADTARTERDEWQQACQFMERIGFANTRADGSPA